MDERNYFVPKDIEEALALKKAGAGGARYLAGGTLINWGPVKDETSTLIDLRRIIGSKMDETRDDYILEAGVTLQKIADNPGLPELIRRGASLVAARQVRNIATLGGNIAALRQDSNMIPALLVSGSILHYARAGEVSLEEMASDPAAFEDDIILKVAVPKSDHPGKIEKVTRSHNGYPILIAAVTLNPVPRIVVNGALPAILRLAKVEEALTADPALTKAEIEKIAAAEVPAVEDLYGSVEYKKYITGVTVADLVEECRSCTGDTAASKGGAR